MIEMKDRNNMTAGLASRWISILRVKASEYEHPARRDGEVVTSPSIDDICNEINAFFIGLRSS